MGRVRQENNEMFKIRDNEKLSKYGGWLNKE